MRLLWFVVCIATTVAFDCPWNQHWTSGGCVDTACTVATCSAGHYPVCVTDETIFSTGGVWCTRNEGDTAGTCRIVAITRTFREGYYDVYITSSFSGSLQVASQDYYIMAQSTGTGIVRGLGLYFPPGEYNLIVYNAGDEFDFQHLYIKARQRIYENIPIPSISVNVINDLSANENFETNDGYMECGEESCKLTYTLTVPDGLYDIQITLGSMDAGQLWLYCGVSERFFALIENVEHTYTIRSCIAVDREIQVHIETDAAVIVLSAALQPHALYEYALAQCQTLTFAYNENSLNPFYEYTGTFNLDNGVYTCTAGSCFQLWHVTTNGCVFNGQITTNRGDAIQITYIHGNGLELDGFDHEYIQTMIHDVAATDNVITLGQWYFPAGDTIVRLSAPTGFTFTSWTWTPVEPNDYVGICSVDQCPTGMYTSTTAPYTACDTITTCEVTEYMSKEATVTTDRVCVTGTECDKYLTETQSMTPTSDRTCTSCPYVAYPRTTTTDAICSSMPCGTTIDSNVVSISFNHASATTIPDQYAHPEITDTIIGTVYNAVFVTLNIQNSGVYRMTITGENYIDTVIGVYSGCTIDDIEWIGVNDETNVRPYYNLLHIFLDSSELYTALISVYDDQTGECTMTIEPHDCHLIDTHLWTPACTDNTVCTTEQYELLRATATSDRVCADMTVCTDTQYEITPATSTTDRICADLTLCAYLIRLGSSTSDNTCHDLLCGADVNIFEDNVNIEFTLDTDDWDVLLPFDPTELSYNSYPIQLVINSDGMYQLSTSCVDDGFDTELAVYTACDTVNQRYIALNDDIDDDNKNSAVYVFMTGGSYTALVSVFNDATSTCTLAVVPQQCYLTPHELGAEQICTAFTDCPYFFQPNTATTDRTCTGLVCGILSNILLESSNTFQLRIEEINPDVNIILNDEATFTAFHADTVNIETETSQMYKLLANCPGVRPVLSIYSACGTNDAQWIAFDYNALNFVYVFMDADTLYTITLSSVENDLVDICTIVATSELCYLNNVAVGQEQICTPFTVCSSTKYESLPPTATSNRVCISITTCTDGQQEMVAPTATSDRICSTATTTMPPEKTDPLTGASVELIADFLAERAKPGYVSSGRIVSTQGNYTEDDAAALDAFIARDSIYALRLPPTFQNLTKYDVDGNGEVDDGDVRLLAHLIDGQGAAVEFAAISNEQCAIGISIILNKTMTVQLLIAPAITDDQLTHGTYISSHAQTLLEMTATSISNLMLYQVKFIPAKDAVYSILQIQPDVPVFGKTTQTTTDNLADYDLPATGEWTNAGPWLRASDPCRKSDSPSLAVIMGATIGSIVGVLVIVYLVVHYRHREQRYVLIK